MSPVGSQQGRPRGTHGDDDPRGTHGDDDPRGTHGDDDPRDNPRRR